MFAVFFFFKQKTAYEMRISDWSSDVCSSDLIHFICPQQIEEAIASGVTTMVGGGTGPATGTNATTCTPGPWHIERMLLAAEGLPINLAFAGKGNASQTEALVEQIRPGAAATKLHAERGRASCGERVCTNV